jgi:hypothetical protein
MTGVNIEKYARVPREREMPGIVIRGGGERQRREREKRKGEK